MVYPSLKTKMYFIVLRKGLLFEALTRCRSTSYQVAGHRGEVQCLAHKKQIPGHVAPFSKGKKVKNKKERLSSFRYGRGTPVAVQPPLSTSLTTRGR
jgi:hypothetical protein